MIGALNKVWPWKETLSWRVNSSGEKVPLNEASVWPWTFLEQAGQDPQVLLAVVMALAGFGLVLLVEWIGSRRGACLIVGVDRGACVAKLLPNAHIGCFVR